MRSDFSTIRHAVLVHGTWGNGFWRTLLWKFLPNKWRGWKPDWPIKSLLERKNITVHCFAWSGANTHSARHKAARELASVISLLKATNSGDVCVVAHSHGGNVALYALAGLAPVKDIKIVFLATPFLHFSPRKIDLNVFRALPRILPIYAFVFVFFIAGLSDTSQFLSAFPSRDVGLVVEIALLCAVAIAFAYYIAHRSRSLLRRAALVIESLPSICADMQPPPPPHNEVLILRKIGDEIPIWLESWRLPEFAAAGIWRLLSWLANIPQLISTTVVHGRAFLNALILLAAIIVLVAVWNYFVPGLMAQNFAILFFFLLNFVEFFLVAAIVQLLVLFAILATNVWRYGTGIGISGSAFIQIFGEALPVGKWNVSLITAKGDMLAHSELHADPKVAEDIVNWLFVQSSPKTAEV